MMYAKGKWKIVDAGNKLEITTSIRQRDGKVCVAEVEVDFGDPFNQEQIDSAKLICSAPDLLKSLEDVCAAYKKLFEKHYGGEIGLPTSVIKANTSIAAAKGE